MPRYDFKCSTCKTIVERSVAYELRESTTCLDCGNVMQQMPVLLCNKHSTFPSGMWEHLAPEAINIRNKRQLQDECEKNECYAPGII